MHVRSRLALLALAAMPSLLVAQQHSGGSAPRSQSAPAEARQFDFLIGQWDLTVKPLVNSLAAKIHGAPRMLGTWKAWRAFDGWGVEDELRIIDGSGNPASLSHALRVYDPNTKQWAQTVLDVYRTKFSSVNAEWTGTEMTMTSKGTDAEGKPTLLRTRFFNITPTSFQWQQDRSTDDGKKWTEGTLKIDAKRVAATAPR